MTSTPEAEGSEDVNDFLKRIRELGEKRDKEDEERTKKLEEEILQGRKERQARRAERARSISPTKDSSPLLDPVRLSMSSLSHRPITIDPPEQLEPTPRTPVRDTYSASNSFGDDTGTSIESSPAGSCLGGSEKGASPPPKPSPTLRSRAGTLSWQQRPTSRDLSGNRSFFSTSPSRESRWRAMSNASHDESGLRSPLTTLPASRESTFLRRAQGDDIPRQEKPAEDPKATPTAVDPIPPPIASPKTDVKETQAQETQAEECTEQTKENSDRDAVDERSPPPSRASSSFADSSTGNRYSSISSVSTTTGLGSPIPLTSAQKLEPTQLDGGLDTQIGSPPSPRRLSPERSTSPTKGLGGFVQSAMLRRSDSISKRWSAQLPATLNRGSSFANNRNSFAAPSNTDIFATPKPSRESPAVSPQRPTSSHSEATIINQAKEDERPSTPPVPGKSEQVVRPPLALHSRSTSTISVENPVEFSSRPTTPVSRTMDPKRWSPTKSTWLESALNRPESPRHKRQPSQQTPWNKDRPSRGSVDLGRRNSFKEVTPIGLLRTTPLGAHVKKPSLSGIPDVLSKQPSSPAKEEHREEPNEELPTDLSPTKEKIPSDLKNPISAEISPPESKDAEVITEALEVTQETEDKPTQRPVPPALSPTPRVNTDVPILSPREPMRDPLLGRPKPQSPVVDFRANLRKREVVKDQSASKEPEFKNVFGKLRKAETSNYVAPDELKNNILRGKAALNITGGPKKTQRVDDFKESILKQKEAMKVNGGSVRRSTVGQSDAPAEVVPEALLKRQHLAKPSNDKNELPVDSLPSPLLQENVAPESPHARQSSLDSLKDKQHAVMAPHAPSPAVEHVSGHDEPSKQAPTPNAADLQLDSKATDYAEDHLGAVDAVNTQDGPLMEAIKPVHVLSSVNTTQNTPLIKNDPAPRGSLAGRVNPALAGLLSRGPPGASDGTKQSLPATTPQDTIPGSQFSATPPTLTHMTKGRARGPKRRPPKVDTQTDPSPNARDPGVSPKTTPSSFDMTTPGTSFSPVEPPLDISGGWPLPDQGINSRGASETHVLQSSPSVKPTESLPPVPEKDTTPISTPSTPSKKPLLLERTVYDAGSQQKSPSLRSAFTPSQPIASPSSPHGSQARSPLAHYSSPSPSPLRTSFRENQSIPSPRLPNHSVFSRSRDSSPFRKSLPSPPVPPKGPYASTDQLSSPRSSISLVPQADESLEAISAFFKTFPRSSDRVDIDPQLMLTNKNDGLTIRTLKKQIWEITGEGRKQDLPVNQEYILYEGAMYLCVHVFEDESAVHSEVYLWCGDDVWGGAVDNALPFARKVARENGSKLEIVGQGKEHSRFIQALGGILITRRGSSSRSSSSAIFMLCGRQHLGQMVFDEVDFAPQNLCTGFPFVISAMFGKVYLWKGKGSSAVEIGAARLIGMDLGLTGEFEEVSEGEEPGSFYEVFPQHKDTGDYLRSENWLLKPAHDHFRLRLLRVDHELGQRSFWIRRPGSASPVIRPNDTVQEVEPYSQKDLSPKGIYILDAFFEIYVIVGDQASNRPAEFASAIVFAHEYGILAASLQDRPFIPRSFISLGGAPESCRSAFRKWSRRPLQRPPQVFPLNAAIDAIRS
ncbi:hypothetical protein BJY04DRAFT_228693 [Aspergillus karnatakaensis]|uniref:putative gelsolin repeat protein n=1 Tax=Aspergillus karnatakaensis TaxID=1810916 RepID=UPI003CCDB391